MCDNSMLTIKQNKTGIYRSSGFTMVELLLAMLLGLIIMSGVMQLFITTQDTQRTNEDQMQMIADARFIIDTIAFDLRHAGIWGHMNETKLIACKKNSELDCPGPQQPTNAASDCNGGDHYRDLDFPVFATNNANPYPSGCITQGYQPNTDVLEIRYADTLDIGSTQLAAGVAYVRSNILAGQVFVGPTYPLATSIPKWIDDPLDSVTKNFPLRAPVYYVSNYTNTVGDGMPSLHRVELRVGPEMKDIVLIPGVEDFQVEFGIDTDNDGQVNAYVNPATVSVNNTPTANADWLNGSVIAVKIWVLMRSEREDRDLVYDQTFVVANNAVLAFNDGFQRFLVTDVVRLRNTQRLDLVRN